MAAAFARESRQSAELYARPAGELDHQAGPGANLQVNIVMPAVQAREQGDVIDIPVRR